MAHALEGTETFELIDLPDDLTVSKWCLLLKIATISRRQRPLHRRMHV